MRKSLLSRLPLLGCLALSVTVVVLLILGNQMHLPDNREAYWPVLLNVVALFSLAAFTAVDLLRQSALKKGRRPGCLLTGIWVFCLILCLYVLVMSLGMLGPAVNFYWGYASVWRLQLRSNYGLAGRDSTVGGLSNLMDAQGCSLGQASRGRLRHI